MEFIISGSLRMGTGNRTFTKQINAESELAAKEKVLALFGSQNGLKRSMIRIDKIEKKG
jgi:ribosomal protein L20A (L18A)